MKVAIDDKIPFIQGMLEPYAEVVYLPWSEFTPQTLEDIDALVVRTRVRCNANLLEGTAVRFIASATIGYDHIDTAYCDTKGITWTNAAGCNSSSVEQYVLAALLELSGRLDFKLSERTIGIVGVGNVGSKVARVATLLGMNVLLCDPPRAKKGSLSNVLILEELAAKSDIVTVHVSLSREGEYKTYGMFDQRFFNTLKSGAIFINSSRGEVVNEPSLKDAIRSGKLLASVLDVWCNEPDIDTELMSMISLATPHIAGYSVDGKAKGSAMSVQALARYFGISELYDWAPVGLPLPENTTLYADFKNQQFEDILRQLVLATYPVANDDKRLRQSPERFEHQRGSYPLRREYSSYSVQVENAGEEDVRRLIALGFNIEQVG